MKKCICGNALKPVKNCKTKFNKTCGSVKCQSEIKKQTNIKRYGHSCSLHGTNKERIKIIIQKKIWRGYNKRFTIRARQN